MSTYDVPALQEIGDFDDLTKGVGVPGCCDFVACGYAPICLW